MVLSYNTTIVYPPVYKYNIHELCTGKKHKNKRKMKQQFLRDKECCADKVNCWLSRTRICSAYFLLFFFFLSSFFWWVCCLYSIYFGLAHFKTSRIRFRLKNNDVHLPFRYAWTRLCWELLGGKYTCIYLHLHMQASDASASNCVANWFLRCKYLRILLLLSQFLR